jgi:hypothetical protein
MRNFVVHRFPAFLFALNYSSNYLPKKLAIIRIAHSYIAINDIYADFFALFVYCKDRRENRKLIARRNTKDNRRRKHNKKNKDSPPPISSDQNL